ncbi:MAG: restriction endonuclease subunit S [Algoriphagus sp.]|uniref:restriction endonuclease subunit S n=1 Tax=Algoriphagus sp. TaxID=1872435 RepID=UPI002614EDFE|nr:restriction endonuclease subunit S [Algoriphagus sp.]MDG1279617.1 restriction endonuclease subunit S [Algoriphagus sp.]
MSKVKPYLDYSDFGQEWLGDLPAHWKAVRTKLLFDLVSEPAPVGNSEELLSVYTALGVKPRKELEARGNKASSTDNYWRVEQGDIIVNKLLAWMGAIGISEYKGVTSPAYDILRHNENVNPYFYNYLFRNPIASREFKRHSRGIMDMRLRLYFTRFGDIKLPYPPIDEQNKIVEYLQFKLKRIDRFILKKKQLIKLLNKQKEAIINQAVTKGLDSKAKMKPSGIDWLGDVPEHWEVKKLKYVANCFPSNIDKHSKEDEMQVRLCNYTDVYKNDFITNNMELMIATASNDQIEKFTLLKGDVIITKDSETADDIANPALVIEELENVVCGYHLSVLRPYSKLEGSYLLRALQCKAINVQFEVCSNGVTRVGLGVYDMKSAKIPLPPKDEQQLIVNHIVSEVDKIHKTISTIEKEITLTQEYKTALIAEAVTGKIDVRDFEIPETQEEDPDSYRDEDLEDNPDSYRESLVAEDEADYQNEEIEE